MSLKILTTLNKMLLAQLPLSISQQQKKNLLSLNISSVGVRNILIDIICSYLIDIWKLNQTLRKIKLLQEFKFEFFKNS